MLDCVVVTQGRLAAELVSSAEVITGRPSPVRVVCLDWDETLEQSEQRLRTVVDELRDGGLLLLTDLFGGTPYRLARDLRVAGAIECVTGVNLAMVVYLSIELERAATLTELVTAVVRRGRQSVRAGDSTDADPENAEQNPASTPVAE